jgi:hypothetical protein
MVRGLGIVAKSPNGKKYIEIMSSCPQCGTQTGHIEILPDSMQDIPEGFIAFLDSSGKLSFVEEDPHDYHDGG